MSTTPEAGRLAALVRLLADDRESVRDAAAAALAAVPSDELLAIVEAIEDARTRTRSRARLESVRVLGLENELRQRVADLDLEKGAFLLARFRYPELDAKAYAAALDGMASSLRAKLGTATPTEALRILRTVLHEEHGFRGGRHDDPECVFLNRVIDTRLGIPTSLACVWLLVARRAGVALEGVNFPLSFLLRSGDKFIEPFAGGRFLSQEDARDFLRSAGVLFRPEHFSRATDRAILARLARNLIASFRATGALPWAARYERCLEILDPDGEHADGAPDRP